MNLPLIRKIIFVALALVAAVALAIGGYKLGYAIGHRVGTKLVHHLTPN
jgi:phosphate/sulfate permease